MLSRPSFRRPLLALATLASILTNSRSEDPKLQPVQCRILCFERADDATELVTWGARAGSEATCPLSTTMPSDPVRIGAINGVIRFFRKAAAPAAGEGTAPAANAPAPLPQPVAIATLPANCDRALLLFVPEKQADGRLYNVVVIEEVSATFPGGGAFVCNLYNSNVRFVVGEHKMQLGSRKVLHLPMPKQRDDFNMATVAVQFEDNKGSWRTATETRLRFTQGLRQILVTFLDKTSGRPRLRTFTDTPPVPQPYPPAAGPPPAAPRAR